MTKIEQLEKRIKDLERKVCCKTQFFDTVDDLPLVGSTGVIYVTDDGNIYVWNGSEYVLNGLGDAYYTNSYVERLKALGSNVQYSNYIGTGTSNTAFAQQILYLMSIHINKASILNGFGWFQQTQGNYVASDYNGIGLYEYDTINEKLILIASTSNDGDIWKALPSSYNTKDFTNPISISSGVYYIGLLYNTSAQTQSPIILAHNSFTTISLLINALGLPASAKLNGTISSITTLPTEILDTDIGSVANSYIFNLY